MEWFFLKKLQKMIISESTVEQVKTDLKKIAASPKEDNNGI